MSSAPHYQPHYTYRDYCQWDGQWELWGGTAVAMTPSPYGPHERLVSRLSFVLTSQINQQKCNCIVYTGLDWVVSDDTVVRPDVMVVCGDQPQLHLQSAPSLIVEVLSAATESKDRNEKRALYQQQGVPYYLLGDPRNKTLIGYELKDQYEILEFVFNRTLVTRGCKFTLDTEQVFPA